MKPLSEVLEDAGEFFMGKSSIHKAAYRLARALSELEIPFVVVGALAVNAHGHVRTTADIDILLNPEGLEAFKGRWLGQGWVELFEGSKGFRDATLDVKIDVLLSGEFPGDGKPKPIAFPRPEAVEIAESSDGYPVLALRGVVELKLASGMTAPHRPRDFDDVIQLIRVNALGRDYSEQLDPYVQAKFQEMWEFAQVEEDA
jgi:hypothetical protein